MRKRLLAWRDTKVPTLLPPAANHSEGYGVRRRAYGAASVSVRKTRENNTNSSRIFNSPFSIFTQRGLCSLCAALCDVTKGADTTQCDHLVFFSPTLIRYRLICEGCVDIWPHPQTCQVLALPSDHIWHRCQTLASSPSLKNVKSLTVNLSRKRKLNCVHVAGGYKQRAKDDQRF